MNYREKYLKYKIKYLNLKDHLEGGVKRFRPRPGMNGPRPTPAETKAYREQRDREQEANIERAREYTKQKYLNAPLKEEEKKNQLLEETRLITEAKILQQKHDSLINDWDNTENPNEKGRLENDMLKIKKKLSNLENQLNNEAIEEKNNIQIDIIERQKEYDQLLNKFDSTKDLNRKEKQRVELDNLKGKIMELQQSISLISFTKFSVEDIFESGTQETSVWDSTKDTASAELIEEKIKVDNIIIVNRLKADTKEIITSPMLITKVIDDRRSSEEKSLIELVDINTFETLRLDYNNIFNSDEALIANNGVNAIVLLNRNIQQIDKTVDSFDLLQVSDYIQLEKFIDNDEIREFVEITELTYDGITYKDKNNTVSKILFKDIISSKDNIKNLRSNKDAYKITKIKQNGNICHFNIRKENIIDINNALRVDNILTVKRLKADEEKIVDTQMLVYKVNSENETVSMLDINTFERLNNISFSSIFTNLEVFKKDNKKDSICIVKFTSIKDTIRSLIPSDYVELEKCIDGVVIREIVKIDELNSDGFEYITEDNNTYRVLRSKLLLTTDDIRQSSVSTNVNNTEDTPSEDTQSESTPSEDTQSESSQDTILEILHADYTPYKITKVIRDSIVYRYETGSKIQPFVTFIDAPPLIPPFNILRSDSDIKFYKRNLSKGQVLVIQRYVLNDDNVLELQMDNLIITKKTNTHINVESIITNWKSSIPLENIYSAGSIVDIQDKPGIYITMVKLADTLLEEPLKVIFISRVEPSDSISRPETQERSDRPDRRKDMTRSEENGIVPIGELNEKLIVGTILKVNRYIKDEIRESFLKVTTIASAQKHIQVEDIHTGWNTRIKFHNIYNSKEKLVGNKHHQAIHIIEYNPTNIEVSVPKRSETSEKSESSEKKDRMILEDILRIFRQNSIIQVNRYDKFSNLVLSEMRVDNIDIEKKTVTIVDIKSNTFNLVIRFHNIFTNLDALKNNIDLKTGKPHTKAICILNLMPVSTTPLPTFSQPPRSVPRTFSQLNPQLQGNQPLRLAPTTSFSQLNPQLQGNQPLRLSEDTMMQNVRAYREQLALQQSLASMNTMNTKK